MKKSEIKFAISLDANKHPDQIHWSADDSGIEGEKECKAVMVSIWDGKDKSTLRIDLWTKEMMVEEMQHFFYETLRSMADTYKKATSDTKAADELSAFAQKFGKMASVLK